MSTLHTLRLHALACAVTTCLCAPLALAQDATPPAPDPAHPPPGITLDGRAGRDRARPAGLLP